MRKKLKISFIIVLVMGLFLNSGCSNTGDEIVVTTEQELQEAAKRSEAVVFVNDIIHINETIEITETVTIRGSGAITVSDDHRHFAIQPEGHLTLRDSITLTRAEDYTNHGGGIFIHGGTLTMYGGRIYNNAALRGGGVLITLDDYTLGTFEMRGGEISGNTAEIAGGGVFVELGIAELRHGQISSNTASGHGGVYAHPRGGILTIGTNMRIFDNTPINTHDQESTSLFMRLITPDLYRFAAVVIIVLIGVLVSSKWQKRKQLQPGVNRLDTLDDVLRETQAQAKVNGKSEMTLDEINDIISEVRQESRGE